MLCKRLIACLDVRDGRVVKGTNFTAPKGTIVKRIRLVTDNTEQIEGKINEQTIAHLYNHYRDDYRHAFVHQPESLLVWHLKAKHMQSELVNDWPGDIPREELDGLLSLWVA